MEFVFVLDSDTGEPHIMNHGIDPDEAIYIVQHPLIDCAGSEGTRVAAGQTENGRYLRIIYRRLEAGRLKRIITGYDLSPKAKRALQRQIRRRP